MGLANWTLARCQSDTAPAAPDWCMNQGQRCQSDAAPASRNWHLADGGLCQINPVTRNTAHRPFLRRVIAGWPRKSGHVVCLRKLFRISQNNRGYPLRNDLPNRRQGGGVPFWRGPWGRLGALARSLRPTPHFLGGEEAILPSYSKPYSSAKVGGRDRRMEESFGFFSLGCCALTCGEGSR